MFPKRGKEFLIMAIFRVDKTKNYTVMSNYHLRDMRLTLKAKGLLSQMLSLPEDWDFTLQGLSQINRESVDAIRTAVQELEKAGYITRSRERKENGQLGDAEYIIREQPDNGTLPPEQDLFVKEKPTSENPIQAKSTLGNTTQLNKEEQRKDKSIKELLKKDHIYPIPSALEIDKDLDKDFLEIENELRENTRIDALLESHPEDRELLHEMFDLIRDTAAVKKRQVTVAGGYYSPEFVRERLLRLTDHHLLYVLDCIKKSTTKIRNIKAYMLASLFNAPTTIDSYYTTLVSHDIAAGRVKLGKEARDDAR
jgi:hypothetical protein